MSCIALSTTLFLRAGVVVFNEVFFAILLVRVRIDPFYLRGMSDALQRSLAHCISRVFLALSEPLCLTHPLV